MEFICLKSLQTGKSLDELNKARKERNQATLRKCGETMINENTIFIAQSVKNPGHFYFGCKQPIDKKNIKAMKAIVEKKIKGI